MSHLFVGVLGALCAKKCNRHEVVIPGEVSTAHQFPMSQARCHKQVAGVQETQSARARRRLITLDVVRHCKDPVLEVHSVMRLYCRFAEV